MSKVWFITGASRGLGRSIAQAASAAGHTVVATARDEAAVADLPHPYRLDVTDAKGVADVVSRVVAEHGQIDVLVNNAGHGLVGSSRRSVTTSCATCSRSTSSVRGG